MECSVIELIKEGLYLESYVRTNSITGAKMTIRKLYSADGYCFYDRADEYYDDKGNYIPEEDVLPTMRIYYRYMSLAENRNIEELVPVKKQEGYNVA